MRRRKVVAKARWKTGRSASDPLPTFTLAEIMGIKRHLGFCPITVDGHWPGDPPDVVHVVTTSGAKTFMTGAEFRFVEDT